MVKKDFFVLRFYSEMQMFVLSNYTLPQSYISGYAHAGCRWVCVHSSFSWRWMLLTTQCRPQCPRGGGEGRWGGGGGWVYFGAVKSLTVSITHPLFTSQHIIAALLLQITGGPSLVPTDTALLEGKRVSSYRFFFPAFPWIPY